MERVRKLASLLLALVMVFSLAMTVFAEEGVATPKENGDFTVTLVNSKTGHTYAAYQVFKGDLLVKADGTKVLSNIEWGSGVKTDGLVAALIAKNNNFLGLDDDATAADVAEALGKQGDDSEAAIAFASVIDGFLDTYAATSTVPENGKYTITGLKAGYYLVKDTGNLTGNDAYTRNILQVVADVEAQVKTEIPDIDKKIIDEDANKAIDGDNKKTDTAAIGDTIEYEVTGKVPDTTGYTYYYYVLNDTLSKGLTLQENSFAVTIGGSTLTKGTDYYVYVTKNEDGTTSFQLAFENMKGYTADADISVKYNATVNDNAVIGLDPNTNTVKLQYSNNPNVSNREDSTNKGTPGDGTATGETPTRTTKTYVTELTILKVDQDGKKLAGAEFTLTGENLTKVIVETNTTFREAAEGETPQYYKLKNGTYTKAAPSSAAVGEEGYNADKYEGTVPKYVRVTTVTTSTAATGEGTGKKIVGTVNAEGYVTFTGLNAGTYTLTETVTPPGYNTAAPITFTISAIQNGSSQFEGGSITWSSDNANITLDAANGVFDTAVVNQAGAVLPSTGGMGTTLFYIVGSVLALGAAVLLVTKKRMSL